MIPVKFPPEIKNDFLENIFIVEDALTVQQCQSLIDEIRPNIYEGQPSNWAGIWNKGLLPIDHNIQYILNEFWLQAEQFYKTNIKFIEPYHIKSYKTLNYYGSHTDNYVSVAERLDRRISLVVQLSDENDYAQGELVVAGNIVSKKRGAAIFFPSNYIHHVNQVKRGERFVLISWAWGSTF
ncbi:MAG: 2OG-Fe(II) oxygenase [Alphaproteobacteria bacterium]|nr:2OG-Fe(II) oxygenase [Alphaproteobacteria bacterium]